MSARTRALRALPFTFALYVFEAALATLFALPFALEWVRRLRGAGWDQSEVALALESVSDLAPALRSSGGSALLAVLALVLLSPWLQMSWYAALREPQRPLRALIEGAEVALRACWVTFFWGITVLLAWAPFVGLAYGLHSGLASSTDTRLHDLAVLGALTPLLPITLLAWLAHDLARAGVLHERAFSSLLRALREVVRLRVLSPALLLLALGYGVVLASQWLGLALRASAWSAMVPTLLQCALFFRLFLRSWWLGTALTCMHPERAAVGAPE